MKDEHNYFVLYCDTSNSKYIYNSVIKFSKIYDELSFLAFKERVRRSGQGDCSNITILDFKQLPYNN